jgi:hypothetical protein
VFGIDSNSTACGTIVKKGYNPAATGTASFLNINASAFSSVGDAFTLINYTTFMAEFDSLIPDKVHVWRMGSTPAGTPFSALSGNFTPAIRLTDPNDNAGFSAGGIGLIDPRAAMGVFIGVHRAGSGTSLIGKFIRLRLDYQFND